jgi:hypothetical protein
MTTVVLGVVKDGLVVHSEPLPEGTAVEIRVCKTPISVAPEERADFDSWDRASADALFNFENMLDEEEAHETR